jgi:hypothetical protein
MRLSPFSVLLCAPRPGRDILAHAVFCLGKNRVAADG